MIPLRIVTRTISAWCAYVAAKRFRRDERLLDKMEPARAKLRGRYAVARGRHARCTDVHKQLVTATTELLRR